jgi:hypothetical protein
MEIAMSDKVDLFDPDLATLAGMLDDIEGLRKAMNNRVVVLAERTEGKDGVVRGYGLGSDHKGVKVIQERIAELEATEHATVLSLQKAMKAHPLGALVAETTGLGMKTVARLLGEIGDPYWHKSEDRPRSVSELFSYCGIAGPGYRRKKGCQCAWNTDARTKLFNIVEPTIRGKGPYRAVYDAGRERYANHIHSHECMNQSRSNPNGCGTREHPEWGDVGAPWRPGHQHKGAMRLVMREVLRDLWEESKAWHKDHEGL